MLLKRSLDKEEPLESNSCNSITVAIRIHEIGYIYICIRNIIGIETLSLGNVQNAHSVRS